MESPPNIFFIKYDIVFIEQYPEVRLEMLFYDDVLPDWQYNCFTAGICDLLTENAPYPPCHENP